jgi:hypothetical protein
MNQSNDKGKSAPPVQAKPAPVKDAGSEVERPCPECGEKVRKGLVRCWNCGAFMNATLQARYQEMQTNPAPPIFSQVPESEVTSVDSVTEDDFQLGSGEAGRSRADLRGLESAEAAPATAPAAPVAEPAPGTSHSIATAGDVLFAAAMQEQAENRERRKKKGGLVGGAKTPGGFIIFCPYGCRIEVKEQHRGSQGRCPRCRAPFLVPIDPPDYSSLKQAAAAAAAGDQAAPAAATGRQWLDDLHLHVVPPEKFKLKADSLLKDFVEQDFGFAADSFVRVGLSGKGGGGLFGGGGGDKKKPETRTAVRAHLNENKPLSSAPAGDSQSYPAEQAQELRVVQPAASRAQSLFHGIPVFGAGRIAIMLPISDDGTPQYVSMGVLQFRKLAQILQQTFGIENFGAGCGIPATEEYDVIGKCHWLQTPVKSIKHLEYYQADPTAELVLSGWKCDKCPTVMSEEGRARDKFGGKDGKGIAKTKCPKCAQKFGSNPLYVLKDTGGAGGAKPMEETKPEAAAAT